MAAGHEEKYMYSYKYTYIHIHIHLCPDAGPKRCVSAYREVPQLLVRVPAWVRIRYVRTRYVLTWYVRTLHVLGTYVISWYLRPGTYALNVRSWHLRTSSARTAVRTWAGGRAGACARVCARRFPGNRAISSTLGMRAARTDPSHGRDSDPSGSRPHQHRRGGMCRQDLWIDGSMDR